MYKNHFHDKIKCIKITKFIGDYYVGEKINKVTGTSKASSKEKKTTATWKPSAENKSKATRFRIFAALAWVGAILAQLGAIYYISHTKPIAMWIPIVIMVVDAALVITGGILWKKSNRLAPPSEANKFLFYIQSQLGLIVAIIAFLPLVIFIFTSKDLDKKKKGILGSIAVVLMVAAGLVSTDFNPVSSEDYAAQTQVVQALTGQDLVYGTKSGGKYHLYEDCQHLKREDVKELNHGTVADLHAANTHIGTGEDALCSTCLKRALKEKNWSEEDLSKELLTQQTEAEEAA